MKPCHKKERKKEEKERKKTEKEKRKERRKEKKEEAKLSISKKSLDFVDSLIFILSFTVFISMFLFVG